MCYWARYVCFYFQPSILALCLLSLEVQALKSIELFEMVLYVQKHSKVRDSTIFALYHLDPAILILYSVLLWIWELVSKCMMQGDWGGHMAEKLWNSFAEASIRSKSVIRTQKWKTFPFYPSCIIWFYTGDICCSMRFHILHLQPQAFCKLSLTSVPHQLTQCQCWDFS